MLAGEGNLEKQAAGFVDFTGPCLDRPVFHSVEVPFFFLGSGNLTRVVGLLDICELVSNCNCCTIQGQSTVSSFWLIFPFYNI